MAVAIPEFSKIGRSCRWGAMLTAAFVTALALAVVPVDHAWSATVINGPIDLGTADSFGVLAASTVTNANSSVVDGDLGLSPGSAVTGFPPGLLSPGNTMFLTDGVASQAQIDLRVAMATAASLTPTVSGLGNLTGLSLVPGVYAGGELSLDAAGVLTLVGSATSVWVFTAASTLVTGSASQIVLAGGASACNVFWRVGSSATFGSAGDFVGTVMAEQSITATNGTDVLGRLLAGNGAVTLDQTNITVPTGCAAAGTTSTTDSPEFTSGQPTDATVGMPYSFTVTSAGVPAPSYAVTSDALPVGLALDGTTGEIAGTPVSAGSTNFTITASNGVGSDASAILRIDTLAAPVAGGGSVAVSAAPLPPTGGEPSLIAFLVALVLIGAGIFGVRRPSRARHPGAHQRAATTRASNVLAPITPKR